MSLSRDEPDHASSDRRRRWRYGIGLVCEPPEPAGASVYAIELVRAMAPLLEAGERLVVIRHHRFPRPIEHPRVEDVRLVIPAGRSPVRRFFEQVLLPPAGLLLRLDLLHGVNHVLPLLWQGPSVLTVHDTRLFSGRNAADLGRWIFREHVYPASLRRATEAIAISEGTARDVAAAFGVGAERFHVIPHGVDGRFGAGGDGPGRALLAATAARDRPYVLQVGQQAPHKNVPRLIAAYASALRAGLACEGRPVALVLAGSRGEDTAAIEAAIAREGVERDVVRLGYVSEAALPGLYRGARALAYPSLLEGFGLPPLEAMAAGVPVLAADLPVLREVAGEAALFVDPRDVAAIAAGLGRVVADEPERRRLIERGRERAAQFGWRRTAERTLAIYRRVAGRGGRGECGG